MERYSFSGGKQKQIKQKKHFTALLHKKACRLSVSCPWVVVDLRQVMHDSAEAKVFINSLLDAVLFVFPVLPEQFLGVVSCQLLCFHPTE